MKGKSESTTSKSKSKTSTSTTTRATKTTQSSTVTFEYFAPEARKVCLAGSFNDWDPSQTTLKKEKSGRWTVDVSLKPGTYEYRYLVDGSWQNDQRPVACVRNPYGSSNCILEVSKEQ